MEVEDGKWEIFPVLCYIMEIRNVYQLCLWPWVSRIADAAAHSFASQFDKGTTNLVWLDRPQSSLVYLLNKNGLPCPSETASDQSKSRV